MRISDWSSDVCSSDLGNASIARLLVRDLIPAAMPGDTVESVVTARADYSKLDQPGQPIRIRLSSIAVRAANQGQGGRSGVEVHYRRGGKTYRVKATHRSCRSEEHTSELQSLMRISYAVFCLKKKK